MEDPFGTLAPERARQHLAESLRLRTVPVREGPGGAGLGRLDATLVFEALDWQHGVLVGAGMASETTAAATGKVGVVRRDPMAMKPFCGYNFGDYWAHWLALGEKLSQPPKVFHVNWFRKGADGHFLWPGFGDNLRVLEWMIDRCDGRASGQLTPIGVLPQRGELNLQSLDVPADDVDELLQVDRSAWTAEMQAVGEYMAGYGERCPAALESQRQAVLQRLAS